MALPDNALSNQAYHAAFRNVSRGPVEYLTDYELAGAALYDGTQGMNVKIWTVRVLNKTEVQISAPSVPRFTLFTRSNPVIEVSIAFDNNMFPFVAFVEESGEGFIWWFDSLDSAQKFTALPTGAITPRCCIDDHRPSQSDVTDVVLAYLLGGSLYVRYQRERYQTEHLLQTGLGADARIIEIGMNQIYRMQFWIRNANPVSNAVVFSDPFLGDVVAFLCKRSGMLATQINCDELYSVNVPGYKCNTDDGLNKRIDALREVFFFDKSEVDKKIHFPKRGREVTAKIPYSDLVADDPSALKETRIQEIELPRAVTVNHLDPAGGFAANKQTARRRSNLIKARKEQKLESEVVLTADQAATSAIVKLKIAWYEQQTYQFSTWTKYANVVSTDVVEVENKDGTWHRVRITERNDDHPLIRFEGVADAGNEVYSSLGVGTSLPPPVSTTPGLIGETKLEILNIPVLRDQDDELGVYLAVCGQSSGWFGSQILISTDNGANFAEALQIETPATIGETLTELEDEIGSEYQANQNFEVTVNFPLESVSRENLLKNVNRCVVGDEILQFQFATLLSFANDVYTYRLSGLIRGRYATKPEWKPIGTRFVLIDSSLAFLQAQQWMLGLEILVKPVSLGLTEDETVPTGYDFDFAANQTEWPPHHVTAARDGSNNVTVSFIGRGRLGIETQPYNSKYFIGYRIKFSNGHAIDVAKDVFAAVYNSAPTGLTVQVCGLNQITGEGEFSPAISI